MSKVEIFMAAVSLARSFADKVTLTPSISYMTLLDDHLRGCTDKSDSLYGGAGIEVEF